jgi:DUF4097 and DUF4098 domain-containing protein YvlB
MSTIRPLPLSPARRWILAAGVPAAAALLIATGSLWVRTALKLLARQDQQSYSVHIRVPATGSRIRITDSNGDLTFRTAAIRDIEVTGRLHSSFTRPTLGRQVTSTGLALAPDCAAHFGTCSASLAVTAPAGRPLSVSTSFGELRAADLKGQIALADNTGNLAVSRLTGTIRLNDSFGALTATGLSGSVELVNNTGDIRASAVTGDTTLRDSFGAVNVTGLRGSADLVNNTGDITASGITGDTTIRDSYGAVNVTGLSAADVTVSNNTGDVTLRFATVPDHVVVTDSFGSVTVVLPPGASYRVAARTSFGSQAVRVPQATSSRHLITVTNSNGDIRIITGPGSGG